jgi:hypothetical protein
MVPGTAANIYKRYKRFVPLASFSAGFGWDSLTLTRIDRILDNIILLAYILLLGVLMVLVNLSGADRLRNSFLKKHIEWYPPGIQFFLGGLFSSYVVFYFQSASMTKSSLFLILLIFLLIANEFLKSRLDDLYLQTVLYFLASCSFLIFFIPVVIKTMSYYTFLFSCIISLLTVGGIAFLFHKKSVFISRRQPVIIGLLIGVLFLMLNVFYIKNWIPPVPLSLKSAGIYHQVSKEGDSFELKLEKPSWYRFWKDFDNPYNYYKGDTVYCFTAIFAPTELKIKVYHQWQKYSDKKGTWMTTDKLVYEITGGRGKGYRGYTYKKNVVPGKWRVEVRTEDGPLLGRIDFRIQEAEGTIGRMKTVHY